MIQLLNMAERINENQKHHMVNYIIENTDILRGYCSQNSNLKTWKRKWAKLTDDLNSLGPPFKTETKWRKVWADMRHLTKKKAYSKNRNRKSAGEGPRKNAMLSDIEQKIISLISQNIISGIEGEEKIPESIVSDEEEIIDTANFCLPVIKTDHTIEDDMCDESSSSDSPSPIPVRRKRKRVEAHLISLQEESNALFRETKSTLEDIAQSLRTIAQVLSERKNV